MVVQQVNVRVYILRFFIVNHLCSDSLQFLIRVSILPCVIPTLSRQDFGGCSGSVYRYTDRLIEVMFRCHALQILSISRYNRFHPPPSFPFSRRPGRAVNRIIYRVFSLISLGVGVKVRSSPRGCLSGLRSESPTWTSCQLTYGLT